MELSQMEEGALLVGHVPLIEIIQYNTKCYWYNSWYLQFLFCVATHQFHVLFGFIGNTQTLLSYSKLMTWFV